MSTGAPQPTDPVGNPQGYVNVPDSTVAVQITATRTFCQSIVLQARNGNTDAVFLCTTATPNYTTGAGIVLEVPTPTYNASSKATALPALSFTIPNQKNGIDASQYYVGARVNNEKGLVTLVQPKLDLY